MWRCIRSLIRRSHSPFQKFRKGEQGYVAALSAISMPMLLGFALLIIDGGRGNNLHTDLQNAVDAMALTGGRELDGRNDAIPRSKAAIASLLNSVTFSGGEGARSFGSKLHLVYVPGNDAASTVTVKFLTSIPSTDDHPDWYDATKMAALQTNNSNLAVYVWVKAKPHSMTSMFPVPIGITRSTVNVRADAVATYRSGACETTPIFICNPFEGTSEPSLNVHFANGSLYGRQFILRNVGSAQPGPGNFGFLRAVGTGANPLRHAVATGNMGVCYDRSGVDTEPGATVGPILEAANVRFGIYKGSLGSYNGNWRYRPSVNVRKGQLQQGNLCNGYTEAASTNDAMALPLGTTMVDHGGGKVSTDRTWDIDLYMDVSHGGHSSYPPSVGHTPPDYSLTYDIPYKSFPGTDLELAAAKAAGVPPSRYDVYDYEITHNNGSMIANQAPNGETGEASCYGGYNLQNYPREQFGDRRLITAAVLNCNAVALAGADVNVPVEAFVSMFMTRPAVHTQNDKSMALEIKDITGVGGKGTVTGGFFREEGELVR